MDNTLFKNGAKWLNCIWCKKPFKTIYSSTSFCSDKCREDKKSDRVVKKERTFMFNCVVCGSPFTSNQGHAKACSKPCRDANSRRNYIESREATVFQIFSRDKFRCIYCGSSTDEGKRLTIDHIYPRNEGGQNDVYNLITSCLDCNVSKGASMLSKELIVELWERNRKMDEEIGLISKYDELKAYFDKAYETKKGEADLTQ